LNLLQPIMLIVREVAIERITVVKFRMEKYGTSSFDIEIWTDIAKFTNTQKT